MTHTAPKRPTPNVDALLSRLRARITSNVWLHGIGTAVAFAALWLLAAFLLDWSLHLPGPIRIFNLGLLAAIPAWFLWRELVRPLARRPDRAGLAVLVERAHPELAEVLVSAAQLSHDAHPSGEPELVEAVVAAAEKRAGSIELEPVLDARGPRRRAFAAVGAGALVVLVFALNWTAASVFLARIAGANVPWPQRTHLVIEIPSSMVPNGTSAAVTDDNGTTSTHRVARGSDVVVVVTAAGEIPDEVVLHFDGGHKAVLAAGGGPQFRMLLRSVQENTRFYATGGDDQDEDPLVELVVLQPPDVAGLCVEITPPAYSKLAPRTEFDRDVEVLAGSSVTVHVLTDPASAVGRARILPEDRVVDLVPFPYPLTPAELTAKAAPKSGLGFALTPTKSLRYRFELTDSTGLSNPDPGLFGITVVDDRAPEVEILSPGRGDFDTVAGGLLPLRARVEDDFGISSVSYTVESIGAAADAPKLAPRVMTFVPVEVEARKDSDASRTLRQGAARVAVLARESIEVAHLAGEEAMTEGRQFQLVVVGSDASEPKAHDGRSSPLRVRVVSSEEFMRRLQDRLSRAQTSTSALGELVREKNRRTDELIAALESDGPEGATGELAAALTGQRRIQGDARALARELCSSTESVLYARLDERALAALDMLDKRMALQPGRGFDPAPWRELGTASRDRAIAGSGLAGKLVDIGALALEISEDLAQNATDEFTKASTATDIAKVHEHLKLASDLQKAALAKIDALLERLAEWDNFQSVLTLTRDILNGQKGVSERTRQAAKEPK